MKRFSYRILLALGILFLAGNLFINPPGYSESNINIQDICKPGHGLPVAEILNEKGDAIIIRPKIDHACWAKRGALLYIGDVIATQDTGRVRFGFIDGSLVTLASRTELEITQYIYDRAHKARSLFFNLHSGKAKVDIKKLDGFEEKTAEIKTNTVLVDVKGHDLVIEANHESTKITTFEDTQLEVKNRAFLDKESVVMMDSKTAIFKKGNPSTHVEEISQEKKDKISQDFSFSKAGVKKDTQKEKNKDKDKKKGESGQPNN